MTRTVGLQKGNPATGEVLLGGLKSCFAFVPQFLCPSTFSPCQLGSTTLKIIQPCTQLFSGTSVYNFHIPPSSLFSLSYWQIAWLEHRKDHTGETNWDPEPCLLASWPPPPLPRRSLWHITWFYFPVPQCHCMANGHNNNTACLLPRSAERTKWECDVRVPFKNNYKAWNVMFGNLKQSLLPQIDKRVILTREMFWIYLLEAVGPAWDPLVL